MPLWALCPPLPLLRQGLRYLPKPEMAMAIIPVKNAVGGGVGGVARVLRVVWTGLRAMRRRMMTMVRTVTRTKPRPPPR